MKNTLFVLLILFLSNSSLSQHIEIKVNEDFLLKDKDGSLVLRRTTLEEVGTSTIPEKNCLVNLTSKDGKRYNHINGRINLVTNNFIYTVKEQDFICAIPLEKIVFDSCGSKWNGTIFKSGYPPINKQNDKSFYQVLSEGKATLLKYHAIKWYDDKPFNTPNTTRVYTQSEQYYLYLNWIMYRLDKNFSNLPKLLNIPANQLNEQKPDLKKEQEAIKLIAYYNSL